MKKTGAFLAAAILLMAINANGQLAGLYTTTASPDFGRVGIAASGIPADAKLHIYGDISGGPATDFVPELKISRITALPTNLDFLEIWNSSPGVSNTMLDVINNNGWLGILTPTPSQPLEVAGNAAIDGTAYIGYSNIAVDEHVGGMLVVQGGLLDMSMATDAMDRTINANTTNHSLQLRAGTGGASIAINGANVGDTAFKIQNGSVAIVTTGYAGASTLASPTPTGGVNFVYNNGNSYTSNMLVNNNGKVVIGTGLIESKLQNLTPDGYLLFVAQGILTEKLKVANSTDGTNWSDFVFNKDYNLMPLNKVASYIKENKHLPDIPSANEVAKDGIDVAGMDAKLLQKIEELTLYVIQQQKEIDDLKQQLKQQHQ